MSNGTWDNQSPPPQPQGMPLWLKVVLGCGGVVLLLLTTCIGGAAYLSHRIKQDPEGFKKKVESAAVGFAKGFIEKPWAALRSAVDQLQTDEGAKAFFAANPGLKDHYATEEAFLEAVRGWRPKLPPLPAEIPNLTEGHLDFQKDFGRTQRMRYQTPGGARIKIEWELQNGNLGRVLDLQVD